MESAPHRGFDSLIELLTYYSKAAGPLVCPLLLPASLRVTQSPKGLSFRQGSTRKESEEILLAAARTAEPGLATAPQVYEHATERVVPSSQSPTTGPSRSNSNVTGARPQASPYVRRQENGIKGAPLSGRERALGGLNMENMGFGQAGAPAMAQMAGRTDFRGEAGFRAEREVGAVRQPSGPNPRGNQHSS